MPHRVPFCDLTDGFFKSGLTSRVSSTSLCTSRPVRPEAVTLSGLAPLLGIEELEVARATLVHFSQLRLQNFEIPGVRLFHFPFLLLHRLERTNSQRSL